MNSKKKGNRFELKVANILSKAFNRNLRRTPLSGGHEIKSDIYDPLNDDFLYFVECKHNEDLRFNSLITRKSSLYKFYKKAYKEAINSNQAKKYNNPPIPIIIFRGGDFKTDMVMFPELQEVIPSYSGKFEIIMQIDDYIFITLNDFIERCNTEPLE